MNAIVTMYDAAHRNLFVEDATGAVFVNTSKPYAISDGDLIEITGFTEKSFKTAVETDPDIRVIGHRQVPGPVRLGAVSFPELMSGAWDCRRVTLHGRVRSALLDVRDGGRMEMEVLTGGGVVSYYISHPGDMNAERLLDADVEITGLVGANFDARWQEISPALLSNNASDLKVLHMAEHLPKDAPLVSVSNILQTQSILDLSRRVRVRGVVTAYDPGVSVVVRQNDRSIRATTTQYTGLPLGSVVDLSGFATVGTYGPSLKQVTIYPTGELEALTPYPVTYAQAATGEYSDEFVSLEGKVVSQIRTDALDELTLLVNGHAVTANLLHSSSGGRLQAFKQGTLVRVSGICHVTLEGNIDDPGQTPLFFHIALRSASDIVTLQPASWWTQSHLLELVCALCFASLVICVWALALRRRVSSQTTEIKRSMSLERERSRLLESINSMTPLADWMEDLTKTCELLLPGIRCVCGATDSESEETSFLAEGARSNPFFERKLHDGKGTVLGRLQAYRDDGRAISSYEYEVLEVSTSLAAIAVNQFRMFQELNYSSTHDQLTALPNRRMADACLERALVQNSRAEAVVAVAYIDVDRFKQVNDQHGHKTGDLYLQQIAARLRNAVRSTDLVARIGGDEFLVIAGNLATVPQAELYRERLNACFESPFSVEDSLIEGSASVGLAISPDHGSTSEELKRQADLDMYTAKNRRHAPKKDATAGLYSPADLEAALNDDRFILFYQPLFCADGKLCGLEALLRLKDPVAGIVPPAAFIDVAEESSVIVPLGRWVLSQALADAKRWNLHETGARVMVNVSVRQVEQPAFATEVLDILRSTGLPSHCLELEITERLMMENPPQVMRQLKLLRNNGVRIAIDDFGVQHSSLSALRSLPFDTLKLDRTFVSAIEEDERALHIVGAIISMAQALDKRVVAEGVETEAQIRTLAKFADIDLQGYYFSRPRPSEEVSASLEAWNAGRIGPHKKEMVLLQPMLAMAS